MKRLPTFLNTPARLVTAMVVIVLAAELLIMLLIFDITGKLSLDVWAIADPILLAGLTSPAFYVLIFRTMRNQQVELEQRLVELRQKERYQRALLDNFPFAVWLKDTENRFLVVNEGFVHVFGANSADDMVGKNDFDIAPPDLAERSRADDLEVMKSRKKKNVEEEILTEGSRKCFETYKAPVTDDKGALLGSVGFSRDITQRKQMEHLLASMSEEFQRSVGRELHDNLGQIISAIAYQATAMQNKISATAENKNLAADNAFIIAQARKAITECKRLAHGLVPFELESSGLLAALREYASEISFSHNVACEFVCHDEVEIGDANLELNLFRIAQEAVNNAVRHSGARHVTISLSLNDNILRLSIRDDGSGFADPEIQHEASQGMGLKFMQYRADLIHATLKFNFPAAGGTEVLLEKRELI